MDSIRKLLSRVLMLHLVFVSCSVMTQAASPFTRLNYIINNPTAHTIVPGQLDTTVGYRFNTEEKGTDVAMYYAFNKQLIAGLHVENGSAVNVAAHTNFIELDFDRYNLNMGGGVLSIPSGNQGDKAVSSYGVAKLSVFERLDVHLGIAQRLHEGEDSSFYYGSTLKLFGTEASIEYDGLAMNAGIAANLTPYTKLRVAAKDLSNLDSNGEIRVAVHLKSSMFSEINDKLAKLEIQLQSLSKERSNLKKKYGDLMQKLEKKQLGGGQNNYDESTKTLINTAQAKIRAGKYSEAKSALKQALVFNPDELEMKIYLANLYYITGEMDLFNETMTEVIEENPYFDGIWQLSEDAFSTVKYRLLSEIDMTEDDLLKNSANIETYLERVIVKARSYTKYEDYDKAAELYLSLLKFNPFKVELYYGMYDIYKARKQYVQAEKMLKEALRLFSKNEDAVLEIETKLYELEQIKLDED